MKKYDVVIIGAGPAGLFAADELARRSKCKIALIEKGLDLPERIAVRAGDKHSPEVRSVMLEGFGGAGAFCDGKLTLTTEVGGHLHELVGRSRAEQLIQLSDQRWQQFGAPATVHGANSEVVADIAHRAILCGMKLVTVPLRHIGTDHTPQVLGEIRQALTDQVDIFTQTTATDLVVENKQVRGVVLEDGNQLTATYVIAAPGRSGSSWLREQAIHLGLHTESGPVDLGVRVEVPAAVVSELTDSLFEFKLLYWSPTFDNLVRTFCVCPHGQVVTVQTDDVITVNGHSYRDKPTDNTNFALLVTSRFTEPFDDPIAYGEYIARLANLLGEGVLVQRLGDLRWGRRSTSHRISNSIVTPTLPEATPGDLSYVLPHRHLFTILEMFDALEQLVPGVGNPHTLLYGVEVKLYSSRLKLTPDLETEVTGLYACGDGAGLTRGLMQASASGIAAAQAIQKHLNE